jgi:hypothetical protein
LFLDILGFVWDSIEPSNLTLGEVLILYCAFLLLAKN